MGSGIARRGMRRTSRGKVANLQPFGVTRLAIGSGRVARELDVRRGRCAAYLSPRLEILVHAFDQQVTTRSPQPACIYRATLTCRASREAVGWSLDICCRRPACQRP